MFTVELKSGTSYNITQPVYCNEKGYFLINYIGRENNEPVNKSILIHPLKIRKIY
jgi:hypothetical protein